MYDPNFEATNEETVIAAHWECLRRNSEFRSLSERWLNSEEFRHSHALTSDYDDSQHHTPRCALDWMLTTAQRVRLANFQIKSFKWKRDSRFNFGPIICRGNFSPPALALNNWQEFFSVQPMPDPPRHVHVSQSWDRTSDLFKIQFRIAYDSHGNFGEVNPNLCELAKFLREAAQSLTQHPRKKSVGIANALFWLGNQVRDLAEFYKVFAISKRHHSEKQFKELLHQIRDNFNASVPLIPTKKYTTHKSYYGTPEDWRWFLEAERLGLDVQKSADLRKLSVRYSEVLRAMRGKAPPLAKTHGFTGEKISGKLVKNRRSTVKRHVLAIQEWIRNAYPPEHFDCEAKSS